MADIHVNHCDGYGTLNPGVAHLPHLVKVLGLVLVLLRLKNALSGISVSQFIKTCTVGIDSKA